MATELILPIKRHEDVQRFPFSFENIINADDSVASAEISARVFTGEDADPSHILSGLPALEGNVVFQTVHAGVVGVIYEIDVVATTTLGYSYLIRAVLAIPPSLPAGYGGDLAIGTDGDVPDAFVGDLVSGSYSVTGGVPPYIFTLSSGTFPPGLTVGSSGVWGGQHHGGSDADPFWDYSWEITVTDYYGNSASVPDACRVTNFTISGDVPDGDVGDIVSGAYVNDGHGVLPITYAIDSGTFPSGLSLNSDGTYEGEFESSGYYEWNIEATDAVGNIATLYDDAEVIGESMFYAAIDLEDYVVFSSDSGASFPTQIVSDVVPHSECMVDITNGKLFHWSENSCKRSDDYGSFWNDVIGLPAQAPSAMVWNGFNYLAFANTSTYIGDGAVFNLHSSTRCVRPSKRGDTILGIFGGRFLTLSIDNGGTFSTYSLLEFNTFEGIQCTTVNALNFMIAGNDPSGNLVIGRCADASSGGWTFLTPPATAIAHGLMFSQSGILYLILQTGEFYYSFNMGTSWFTGPTVPYGAAAAYPTPQWNKMQTGTSPLGDDLVLFGVELGGGLNRIYRWVFGDPAWTPVYTAPSSLRVDSIARR